MIKNYNHVCWDCLKSFRNSKVCPSCGKAMQCIGDRWRVPPINKIKAWKIFRKRFKQSRQRPRYYYPADWLFKNGQTIKDAWPRRWDY